MWVKMLGLEGKKGKKGYNAQKKLLLTVWNSYANWLGTKNPKNLMLEENKETLLFMYDFSVQNCSFEDKAKIMIHINIVTEGHSNSKQGSGSGSGYYRGSEPDPGFSWRSNLAPVFS